MKNHRKFLFIFGLQLLFVTSYARALDIYGLHYQTNSQQTRLAFEVTASPKHRVFVLNKPARLVIDIQQARLQQKLSQPTATHPLFARLRYAVKNSTDLRIVVDLKKAINAKNFALASNNKDEHRLLIDLIPKNPAQDAQKEVLNTAADTLTTPAVDKVIINKPAINPIIETNKLIETETGQQRFYTTASNSTATIGKDKAIIIALDAGHGGDDPGAKGQQGTYEKNVVFAITQKLQRFINSHPAMKAVMIRKGDYFIGLRDRMQIARAAKADLFISIHADAFQNTEVRGASVYALSRNGASSEAAYWLAKNENEADLVGGVSLNDKEEVLASVLLDLSQTATQEASLTVADHVLKNLQHVSEMHKVSVQKAGFVVLKSPDIPSILVETAFISNPSEEQNLLNTAYQAKMARAIFNGICDYFQQPKEQVIDSKVAAL